MRPQTRVLCSHCPRLALAPAGGEAHTAPVQVGPVHGDPRLHQPAHSALQLEVQGVPSSLLRTSELSSRLQAATACGGFEQPAYVRVPYVANTSDLDVAKAFACSLEPTGRVWQLDAIAELQVHVSAMWCQGDN